MCRLQLKWKAWGRAPPWEGRRTLSTAVSARLTAGLRIRWRGLLTHRRASLALEAPIAWPWIRLPMKVNRAGPSEGQQPLPFRWETFQHARADPDISKCWPGRHLFRATTLPNGRRHYWLAPRSDDAVGGVRPSVMMPSNTVLTTSTEVFPATCNTRLSLTGAIRFIIKTVI